MSAARALNTWIEGIGVLGPGLDDWPRTAAVLRGESNYVPARCAPPVPSALPAAERRRTGAAVRIALAVATAACEAAQRAPSSLATVFAASGGDGDNCHAICEVLATSERFISPTRFHNSVHNAPAGYWSIAAQAMPPSTSLAAYDAGYPAPLHEKRPIPDAFGLALVLAPVRTEHAIARISVALGSEAAHRCDTPALEELRQSNPAARGLPLLAAIARGSNGSVILDYLAPPQLIVRCEPAA